MAGVLHASARTPPRIRAELQASQETTGILAARYGLNPKTVAKWRKRTTTADGASPAPQRGSDRGRGSHRPRVKPEDLRSGAALCFPSTMFWAACARAS